MKCIRNTLSGIFAFASGGAGGYGTIAVVEKAMAYGIENTDMSTLEKITATGISVVAMPGSVIGGILLGTLGASIIASKNEERKLDDGQKAIVGLALACGIIGGIIYNTMNNEVENNCSTQMMGRIPITTCIR